MALARYTGALPIGNVPLTVWNSGTQVPATLYADDNDPPTPLSNPFTVDALSGIFVFYADDQNAYDLYATGLSGPPIS